ncbi:hypothetical protein E4T39_01329 [Aureobasidium subglaciale]|nr:hypothetical protein E4T39_01329 [Aureobasidium subglaciale]
MTSSAASSLGERNLTARHAGRHDLGATVQAKSPIKASPAETCRICRLLLFFSRKSSARLTLATRVAHPDTDTPEPMLWR